MAGASTTEQSLGVRRPLLLLLLTGLTRSASAQPGSLVTGVVFDSVAGRPLAGAAVQLLLASNPAALQPFKSVYADAEGRYYFDTVPRGRYAVGFLHPRVDSLQIETPLVPVAVPDSGSVVAMLGIPTAGSIIKASCKPTDGETGLLVGRARSATSLLPAAGGSVRVEWENFTLNNRAVQRLTRGATVRTAEDGAFQLCGVPRGGLVRVRLTHGLEASGVVTLMVPEQGLLQRDLFASAEQDTSLTPVTTTRSDYRGVIRGRTMHGEGFPVPRVRVRFADGVAEATSNDEGYFTLRGVPLGSGTLDLRAVGYLPVIMPVDVLGDEPGTPSYVMQTRAEYLDTVKVIAKDVRDFNTGIAGFEQRRMRGIGHYFSKASIDSIAPQVFTDILRRVTGFTLLPSRNGPRLVMHGMGLQMFCAPAVFVNGSRASELDGTGLDALVNVQDLEAVEAYTRTGSMPAQFQTLDGCGALAIWTKAKRGT